MIYLNLNYFKINFFSWSHFLYTGKHTHDTGMCPLYRSSILVCRKWSTSIYK